MTCRSDLADEWFEDYLRRASVRPTRVRVMADGVEHRGDWLLERDRMYDRETDLLREVLKLTQPYGRGLRHDTSARVRHAAARLVASVDLRRVS